MLTIPDRFEYRLNEGGQETVKEGSITHLWPVEMISRMMEFGRVDDPENGLPQYPENMFPIGGTAGQDMILLELSPQKGRIWYWPEREDAWGRGDNKTLGYVAGSFTDFINNLRMGSDAYSETRSI